MSAMNPRSALTPSKSAASANVSQNIFEGGQEVVDRAVFVTAAAFILTVVGTNPLVSAFRRHGQAVSTMGHCSQPNPIWAAASSTEAEARPYRLRPSSGNAAEFESSAPGEEL